MPKFGDRIKASSRHWARSNQQGIIVDPASHDLSSPPGERFCIHFDKPGIGIDQHLLFLDEKDFTVINPA
jgi:hypothetical protein